MTASVLEGKRILAVDDEPDVLDTLADLLGDYKGLTFDRAMNYETGFHLLRSWTYDAVILDIMGVRGFDLLNASVHLGFPTVMLTAHALSAEALKQSIEMGARAYIPKEKMIDIAAFLEDVLTLAHGSNVQRCSSAGGILQQEVRIRMDGGREDLLGTGDLRKLRAQAGHPQEMMSYQTISVESQDGVGFLYLNRPQVLNALSEEMRTELLHFLEQAAADDGLRALVVTGKGRAFSAGGDLNMFKSRYESFREEGTSGTFANVDLPTAFSQFPKPMIAAINGPAVGFGATMPLTCDVRIASIQAQFSFAFVRLGLTPEFGSSYFLPRLVGYGQAAELVFTARMIDAQEAREIGLVNRVVAAEDLLAEAGKMAAEIARVPAGAIRAAKRVLRHGSHSTLEQVLAYEALCFQTAAQTPEHYVEVCRRLDQLKQDSAGPKG